MRILRETSSAERIYGRSDMMRQLGRVARRVVSAKAGVSSVSAQSLRFMSTVRFTAEHEYVKLDGAKATVGITDFAQTQLGDVVYVDLPEEGTTFEKGDVIGAVESVKAASDVYAPVSGTVVASNEALSENPGLVNESAEDQAWFCTIESEEGKLAEETAEMMDGDKYKEFCQ